VGDDWGTAGAISIAFEFRSVIGTKSEPRITLTYPASQSW
jgi:hypothetical protein